MVAKARGNKQRLLPLPLVAIALVILFALGTWQVQRLQWKTALITSIKQRAAEPELMLDCAHMPENSGDLQFRHVKVSGSFDSEKLLYMYAGPYKFKGQQGYRVFAPITCSKEGQQLLVDLGWVPTQLRNNPQEFVPKGQVEISGAVMLGESPRFFTPENQSDKGLWLWIDLQAFKNAVGGNFPDFFIMRGFVDNNYPLGKDVTPKLRNDHLGYVITWYGLAVALALIVSYQRSWWPFQRNT